MLAAACSQRVDEHRAVGHDELVVGLAESNLSGRRAGARQFINSLTLEGLTSVTSEGRAVPRLAESWDWGEDGRVLRLRLRKGVKFHDGSSFDAAAAAAALTSAAAQPENRALYPALADIASIEPDGQTTLTLRLSRPSALLLEDLAVQLSKGDMGIGTGPFYPAANQNLVLEAFDQYYQGKPPISRITVRSGITLRTAWTSLLRGDVDAVSDVPADAVEFIRNDEVNVLPFPRSYQYLIGFNTQHGPLQSPQVRRALNLAIDREALIERVLQRRGTSSNGPIWPGYWAYDTTVPPFGNDIAAAEGLLDGAGFTVGHAPSLEGAPPARLRFTCLLPKNFPVWERIALEVQRNLYAVGVDMRLEVLPFEVYNARISTSAFDAAFIDMISGPTPARAHLFWRSAALGKSGYNVFGYDNSDVEQQFAVLQSSLSEAVVRAATRKLQRLFLDDPPALFIAWNQRARAVRRDFIVPDEGGRDPFLLISRWVPAAQASTLRASAP